MVGDIRLGPEPHDLIITPDGREAWVTYRGGPGLAIIDLETDEISAQIETGRDPHDLKITPDGRTIWVGHWNDGHVTVVDRESRQVLAEPLLPGRAQHPAVSRDGNLVAVSSWTDDNRVWILDAHTYELLDEFVVGPHPHHVAFTPDGTALLVAVSGSGQLAVVDLASSEIRYVALVPVLHGVLALEIPQRPG